MSCEWSIGVGCIMEDWEDDEWLYDPREWRRWSNGYTI